MLNYYSTLCIKVLREIPILLASAKTMMFMSDYMGATFYNYDYQILEDIFGVGGLEGWVCGMTSSRVLRCRENPSLRLIYLFTDLPDKTRKESYRNIGWRAAEKI